ncbi:MAG: hypothetical protein ABI359_09770 [Ginsengibacter sp.]
MVKDNAPETICSSGNGVLNHEVALAQLKLTVNGNLIKVPRNAVWKRLLRRN